MRIVVDTSPLALPRTGIGNYVRGMLAGLAAEAGREHEVVAFAAVGFAGRRRIEAMSKAIVKRILHEPVTRLKDPSSHRHIDAARELFGLDEAAARDKDR